MTPDEKTSLPSVGLLLVADNDGRTSALGGAVRLVLPLASVTSVDSVGVAESSLAKVDVALIDGGENKRRAIESLRMLRGRGFAGPIVIVTSTPDDTALCTAAQSLRAVTISQEVAETSPLELGTAVTAGLDESFAAPTELAYARRVFAAGQATLSLQHSINNPLAALLAELQLLEMDELTSEQRASLDRMLELCRRIIALVRRLDALGTGL